MKKNIYQYLLVAIAALLFLPRSAYAAEFNITVTPALQRNEINFGSISNNYLPETQEVVITVVNTSGVRYRVVQTTGGLLRNNYGAIIPNGKFLVFTKEGSSGALGAQVSTAVEPSGVVLFTSNNSGSADTLKAFYTLRLDEVPSAGIYYTTITYTLEPIDSTRQSAKSITINTSLEIAAQFSLKVNAIGSAGRLNLGRVSIHDPRPLAQEAVLEINTNLGRPYKIIQQMPAIFRNNSGDIIDNENFLFITKSCRHGTVNYSAPSVVPGSPVVIYNSDRSGSSDKVVLLYTLAVPGTQRAGAYYGRLNFSVESDALPTQGISSASWETEVEVEPVFNLEISSGGVAFGRFSAGVKKQDKQVELKTNTNIGKQYQVIQTTTRRLTNIKGEALPSGSFRMWTESGSKGTAKINSAVPVPEGAAVLYVSSLDGKADSFKVNYQLELPPGDVAGGDYTTEIIYTLSTL